jgi:hypothetical protein
MVASVISDVAELKLPVPYPLPGIIIGEGFAQLSLRSWAKEKLGTINNKQKDRIRILATVMN